MPKYRILRDYGKKTDGQLGDFVLHVATALSGNANFTTPPITPAALTTLGNNFNTAVAACVHGTPTDTVVKNTLRDQLIGTMDQMANYVEFEANNNPEKILSSGFSLANTSRTPAVPGMTAILSVTNIGPGRLDLEMTVADNAWTYIVEYTAQPNGSMLTKIFTDPHDAVLTGLTAGTVYSIRAAVMGSGNQTTEWCDAVSHMAT